MLQSTGDEEPAGAQNPGSTGVHDAALARPVALELVPAAHAMGAEAPSVQKEALSHTSHAVAPIARV